MNIIRISTEMEVSVHEFPDGTYSQQNAVLRELIGNGCDLYEHVLPERLYKELHMKGQVTDIPGQCVSMLVDEEGTFKSVHQNLIGSYLYGTDLHGYPIMGNILIVGECWGDDGIDFCGIEESVFVSLKQQLDDMISVFKASKGGRDL